MEVLEQRRRVTRKIPRTTGPWDSRTEEEAVEKREGHEDLGQCGRHYSDRKWQA